MKLELDRTLRRSMLVATYQYTILIEIHESSDNNTERAEHHFSATASQHPPSNVVSLHDIHPTLLRTCTVNAILSTVQRLNVNHATHSAVRCPDQITFTDPRACLILFTLLFCGARRVSPPLHSHQPCLHWTGSFPHWSVCWKLLLYFYRPLG